MDVRDVVLAAGASVRLTRLITTDSLGFWAFVRHARKWANRAEVKDSYYQPGHVLEQEVDPDAGWRSKLVSGLDCPFCVGFWLGALTLGSHYLAKRHPSTLALWRGVAGTLALNYLTAHVSARIEDIHHDDATD